MPQRLALGGSKSPRLGHGPMASVLGSTYHFFFGSKSQGNSPTTAKLVVHPEVACWLLHFSSTGFHSTLLRLK